MEVLNKKLMMKKGYMLEVVSWENDADNYRTQKMTFDTKEEALMVRDVCQSVFKSETNNGGGIGNMMEDDYKSAGIVIVEYLINHLDMGLICRADLLTKIKSEYAETEGLDEREILEYAMDYYDDRPEYFEGTIDKVMEWNYGLMGGSEWYYSRICESTTLYYSAADIYVDVL